MSNALTGNRIKDTYGSLVIVVDGLLYDGLGNTLSFGPAPEGVLTVYSIITTNSTCGAATILNDSPGVGVIISSNGGGMGNGYGQLRITSNGGAWADGIVTTYFQAKNTVNNTLSFMSGTCGDDVPFDRLQFNSLYTQFSDRMYVSTPVPTHTFEIISTNTSIPLLSLYTPSGMTSNFLDITQNAAGDIFSINSEGKLGVSGTGILGFINGTDTYLTGGLSLPYNKHILFNGPFDTNWSIGLVDSFSCLYVGSTTSTQITVGTGTSGPDGFAIGQTEGSSIAEFRSYDKTTFLLGNLYVNSSIIDSSEVSSVDANQRILNDENGVHTVLWDTSNCTLRYNGTIMFDWKNLTMPSMGGNGDGLIGVDDSGNLSWVSLSSGGSLNLQQVCDTGNTLENQPIYFTRTSGIVQYFIASNQSLVQGTNAGIGMYVTDDANGCFLFINDGGAGHTGYLSGPTFTSNQTWQLPNDSGTIALTKNVPTNISGNFISQTVTSLDIVTYTPSENGSFLITGYVNATNFIFSGILNATVTWNDEHNSPRSQVVSAGITSTGYYSTTAFYCRSCANTPITFTISYTGDSITYDSGATITKL